MYQLFTLILIAACLTACGGSGSDQSSELQPEPQPESAAPATVARYQAYTGAIIWDGTGGEAQSGKALVVQAGRVVGIQEEPPADSEVIDLDGRWIVPGFINAHGHVSGRWADDSVTRVADRVRGDLALYARYGVTSVVSLGGAPEEAFAVRDEEQDIGLKRARVKLAGPVVVGDTPDAAAAITQENIRNGVDWIKIRVDDNLGTGTKMPWNAVHEVLNIARESGIPVATHIFYLEDAQRLLEMGTGLIAHSVRDQEVTRDFTDAMLDTGVCYVPTLTREVSTFVYESRPDFFDDPFFLDGAKQSEIERVSEPEFMARVAASPTAAGYKVALEQAKENLKIIADAGVPIAFGTDTGPGGRFLGYFEHMEFDLMAESGMTAEQILLSATSVAADCVGLDEVGTLEPGKWADFVVLDEDPLDDIRGAHAVQRVYVAGNAVEPN
ncbi:MAG: amidohydrolase family protein [Woeseiaceae bacterium]